MSIFPSQVSQSIVGSDLYIWVTLSVTGCAVCVCTVLFESYKFKAETKRLQDAREQLEERSKVELEHALEAETKRLVLENIERSLEGSVQDFLRGFAVTVSLCDLPKSLMSQMRGHALPLQRLNSLINEAIDSKKILQVTDKGSTFTIVHPLLDSEDTVLGTVKFERRHRLSEAEGCLLKLLDHQCEVALRKSQEHELERMMLKSIELAGRGGRGRAYVREETAVTLLEQTVQALKEALNADCVRVFLFNPSQSHVTVRDSLTERALSFWNPTGIVANCIRTGKIANIADITNDCNCHTEIDEPEGCHAKSVLCVPFGYKATSCPIGAIQAINKRNGRKNSDIVGFTKADTSLITLAINHLEIALDATVAQLEVMRQKDKYKLLIDVVRIISANSLSDPERAVKEVLKRTKGLTKTRFLSLFHVNKEGTALVCLEGDAFERGHCIPIGQGLEGKVLSTGEPLVAKDSSSNDIGIMPIKDEDGKVVGALESAGVFRDETYAIASDLLGLSRFEMLHMDVLAVVAREFACMLGRRNCISRMHWFSKIPTTARKRRSFILDYSKEPGESKCDHRERKSVVSTGSIKQGCTEVSKALQSFKSWHCSPWDFSDQMQNLMVRHAFEEFGLVEEFGINRDILSTYISVILSKYNSSVHYHNRNHAFATLQCCYKILSITEAREVLKPLEILGLLIAAIGHDVAHPGFTNAFLIEVKHQLVFLYGEQSVLESHHTYITCSLLKQQNLNFVSGLDSCQLRELNQTIIRAILSTDMAGHFDKIKDLKSKRNEAIRKNIYRTEIGSDKDRMAGVMTNEYLVDTIIHCCDLSGQVYPRDIAQKWSNAIVKEFARQAQHEVDENVNISQYMHNLHTEAQQNKLQLDFIDTIIQPYWDEIIFFFPELLPCYSNLQQNREFYRSETERLSTPKNKNVTSHTSETETKTTRTDNKPHLAIATLDSVIDEYVVESKED